MISSLKMPKLRPYAAPLLASLVLHLACFFVLSSAAQERALERGEQAPFVRHTPGGK